MLESRIINEPVQMMDPGKINRVANMAPNIHGKDGKSFIRAERWRLREIEYQGGDWDINAKEFKDNPFFAVLETWDRGGDFRKTAAWARQVRVCGEVRALGNFKSWREIYTEMVDAGYKTVSQESPWNEYVIVCEGRTREMLFYLGQHRLAMAKHIGLSEIPVKVGFRHILLKP